jgi:peptidyl-tRNA hydrolase, PTH1 family
MLLLVGLGNRGTRYARNRHNIGFMAVEEIAKRYSFSKWRPEFHGLTCEGAIAGVKILLLLPGTLMNDSGRSVASALGFHKLSLDRIIVFHDEIELHSAYVRVKVGGGNAGHNGLRSITAHLGNDYRRVCIGVGRPSTGEPVDHYVLSNFEIADHSWVTALLAIVADDLDLLVEGADERFERKVRDDMIAQGFGEMLSQSSSRPKRTKVGPQTPTDR